MTSTDSLPAPRTIDPARCYKEGENYSVRFAGTETVTRHLWEAEAICATFASSNPQLICTFNGWDMTPFNTVTE